MEQKNGRSFLFKLHNPVDECKESMVFANTDVQAGIMNCAALTQDDVA